MSQNLNAMVRSRLAWLGLAAVIAAFAYWLLLAGGSTRLNYESAEIGRGNLQVAVASSGSVSPLNTVTVGAQVSGQITQVLVDFNSPVKTNQLLAVIDPSTFQSKLRSAQADLSVQEALIGSNDVQVSNARVNLEQSQRDYERTSSLAGQGLMSTSDLEKARNTLEQMQNTLKIAQATLNTSRAQLVRVRAQLEQARIDLSHTQILAPVDGVVIERDIDVGQTVQSAMTAPTLFKIARDLSQVQIETKVDEADIGAVQGARYATFTVDAYPERSFRGRIAQVRINGTATANVVTYSVMVQADNPGLILLPGMTANVKLVTAERRGVLRVPNAALRFHPGQAGAGWGGGAARPGGTGAGGGAPAGGPGGGAGAGAAGAANAAQRPLVALTPEVMQQLGLDARQQAAASAALAELERRIRDNAQGSASNPLGGAMPNFRRMFGGAGDEAAANRQRTLNALASVLSPEQLQKYQALGSASTVRPATLYLLDAGGKPVARSVRIGLADDNYTEVVSGLAEGDKVIVRARAAKAG